MAGFSRQQVAVFAATFACMASRRASLEGWSILKPRVKQSVGISGTWLGVCDTMYMLAYAIGEYLNGWFAEKYPVKKVVSLGLSGSAVVLSLLSVFEYMDFRLPLCWAAVWGVEGYLQSTVYPGCTKIMGLHFTTGRGKIMGLWTANAGVGNILGASIITVFIGVYQFNWESTIVIIALAMLIAGLLLWAAVPAGNLQKLRDPLLEETHMSFCQATSDSAVVSFTLAYSCIKLMNYTIMMWLPLFMSQANIDSVTIGVVMIVYEVAGAVGSFILGWISDGSSGNVLPLLVFVTASVPTAGGLMIVSGPVGFALCAAGLGVSHISTANLISGVITIQLGKQKVGMVTGIIDGTASLVAGIGMLIVGILQGIHWNLVWGLMLLTNLLCLAPLVYQHRSAV